jgi:carboxymethylenebutenolidase
MQGPLDSGFDKRISTMNRKIGFALLFLAIPLLFRAPISRAASDTMPPGEEGAKAALEKSPRHHEWVRIALPGTEVKLNTFVAYPERKDKGPVVIVIQEVYGLTDWIRSVADSLAAEGFIAIAPDLLSGRGPDRGGTDSFPSRDDVVKAVRDLSSDYVTTALNAVKDYGTSLPAASGKFATVGFCWGGGQSFSYATMQPKLAAAVVFYGVSPPLEALNAINAPVLGLYGEDDARVTTTVGPAGEKMKDLKKVYVTHIYKGAGHGFLRAQSERSGANLEAARQAWRTTIDFLRKNLE